MWRRRGIPQRIAAAGTDQRLSVFGALEYRSGVVTTRMAPTGDAVAFLAFLDQVIARWPDDHLVVVMDNASSRKTAAVRAWFAEHAARITAIWLPTSSPQLNLIERGWRFVKSKLAGHRLWNDLDGLQRAAQRVLDQTRATFAAPSYPHIVLRQDFCMPA